MTSTIADADVSDLPPAMRHGELWKVMQGVYYVTGTSVMGWVTFNRGMIVLVENGELSLINAIRLNAEGEAALLKLGKIAHVINLGCHDMDLVYYVRRFGASVYSIPEKRLPEGITALDIREGLPFGRATFINFDRMPPKHKEGVIVLHREGGDVLVTCDVVQNWEDNWGNSYINWIGQIVVKYFGFQGKCIIDTYLIDLIKKKIPLADIKKDYSKLLDLDFRYLLSGHGYCLDEGAKEAMQKSFKEIFRDVKDDE